MLNINNSGILCVDAYDTKRCQEWAEQGECESNPGWMMNNCMKSCKSTKCDMGVMKPQGKFLYFITFFGA